MTDAARDRLKDLINDALELPPEKRQSYLERIVGGDEALLDEAFAMVAEFDGLGDFLEPDRTRASLFTTLRGAGGGEKEEERADFAGILLADRYRLQERMGSGGSSAVYGATDLLTGRDVAVKLLLRIPWDDLGWVRREIAVLRLLRRPGVVRLLDDGVHEQVPFLVMERIRGRLFPGVDPPVDWEVLAPTALALFEAVARMHAHGVVHGDLKPENVIVDASGAPTILDLGISTGPAVLPRGEAPDGIFGTPDYLSPERLGGEKPAFRSDLYALGVMLFEALSGSRPYRGEPMERLCKALRGDPPEDLAVCGAVVPPKIRELVARLLESNPERRPASASEVAAELLGGLPAGDFLESLANGELLRREDGAAVVVDDLLPLFAGPDRLFHLRTDAARELLEKSNGRRGSIVREIAAWLRSGIARLERGTVVVERGALEVLRGMGPVAEPGESSQEDAPIDVLEAERLMNEGEVGRARAVAERVLDRIRREGGDEPAETSALSAVLRASIAEGTERSIELFLYQAGLTSGTGKRRAKLERLARIALLALRRDGDRALALADALGPLTELPLEQIRQSARVMAARCGQKNREAEVLPDVRSWATRTASRDVERQLAETEGWRAYTLGDFEEAARRHEEAVDLSGNPRARMSALLNVASAHLEAGHLDAATGVAGRARELAAKRRHPHYEARAEWILRATAYRSGAARDPDLELVEAVSGLGVPNLEASICLGEAAVAWRGGDESLARELALEAARKWREIGHRFALPLARATAIAAGETAGIAEVTELARDAASCPFPGLGLQVLALLATRHERVAAEHGEAARALAKLIPAAAWPTRREILSVEEALARMDAEDRGPVPARPGASPASRTND